MADIGTVANALAYTIDGIVYPSGDSSASLTGARTIIKRGWFTDADLTGECSIKGGTDYVYVMPIQGGWKDLPAPLGMPWSEGDVTPATVALAVSGQTVTVSLTSGATPLGNAGIRIDHSTDASIEPNSVALYAVQTTDTATTIAAALAALIPGSTSSGAVVTVPSAVSLTARAGGSATAKRITRRQSQLFTVSVWSGSWEGRDKLGHALDAALSGISFITSKNGTKELIQFAGSYDIDTMQSQSIFRRDLRYAITFDTTQHEQDAQLLFGGFNVLLNGSETVKIGDVLLNG
ncbi:hypothetical protein J2D73_18515 [Acetobacter sacchari]|uniref:Uncharacterized protein n=1 Tax=Acetobacter sacchari TaxID=2661687 RepID=A0ABS3M0T7_9PROT|nr:hypothetical protein [Acetobacter sacchari]MBO1361779.1 hypothetical protein [Acetobacter sacchari]